MLHCRQILEEIRSVLLEQGKQDPAHAFHVTSNLNWHRYERQIESALRLLPSSGKVLDIGCGWGHTTAMLSASCPDLKVSGIDIVEVESWAKLKEYGAQFEVCNALALPFANEFDAVISFGCMEHTGNDEKFLNEIKRTLKTGGRLVIFNLPNKNALSEWLAKILGIWHHKRSYTLAEVKDLFKSGGFDITMVRREFIIPAQVDRVSRKIGDLFGKHYRLLDRLDFWLMKTPLAFFAENWAIYAQKS